MGKSQEGGRRGSRITVDYDNYGRARRSDALPLVRTLVDLLNDLAIPNIELARRTGITPQSLGRWFNRRGNPKMADLEACFNAIGYNLVPERIPDDS